MLTALVLATAAFAADDHSTLEGTLCDAAGACTPYAMDLYDGRVIDSLGREGTYTLTPGRRGAVFTYDFPNDRFSGGMNEAPDNCFESVPNVVPLLNMCFAVDDLQLLRQYEPECEELPLLTSGPLPEEDGHWAAGRLTPEQPGGMWVHQVQYFMVAGISWCGQLDHKVQVFVGDAALPPSNTPNVIHEIQVSGASLPVGQYHRQITLPQPVFVPDGQSLFVSIEQPWESDSASMCPAVCTDGPLQGDQSYWSNSATTPYAWQDLNDFGLPELMVRGRVLYAAP